MKKLDCYRLETVGEQSYSLAARFATAQAAEDAKPAAGGYGGRVVPETIVIYDSAAEWQPQLDQEAVMSGMAKLTNREKKALGLPVKE